VADSIFLTILDTLWKLVSKGALKETTRDTGRMIRRNLSSIPKVNKIPSPTTIE
jgi:hypothetical protein